VYKKLKYISFALFLITFSGCSSLPFIGGGVPSLGVEATLGDKQESVVGSIGDSQQLSVDSVSGGITTNNTQEVPIEFMLLMVLGWLLPSPNEIWKGFKGFIQILRGKGNG